MLGWMGCIVAAALLPPGAELLGGLAGLLFIIWIVLIVAAMIMKANWKSQNY
jgi:hypothetical protein